MRPSNSLMGNPLGGATSSSSNAMWATDIVRASFQIYINGPLSGTFKIQASNDQAQGVPASQFAPSNWVTIGSTASIVASTTSAASTFLFPAIEVSYEYLRINYTDSSSGSANGSVSMRMKTLAL